MRRRVWRRLAVAVCVSLVAPLFSVRLGLSAGGDRPNIVVDHDRRPDPRVAPGHAQDAQAPRHRRHEFANAFASYPLCCPSRATFLTGQYSHNHKVQGNTPPLGGYGKLDNSNTVPLWLQSAGYHTAHIGKYLNGYGRDDQTEVSAGWSGWQGLVDPSTYYMYGYTVNDNGTLTAYGHAESDYQKNVLANRAIDVIRERADEDSPFFLSIAPLAPTPSSPGCNRRGPLLVTVASSPTSPCPDHLPFDEEDISDKPSFVHNKARLSDETRAADLVQLSSAAGNAVGGRRPGGESRRNARRHGQLTNTVVVYTSDNGLFHGEHRVSTEKYWAYEESVRVPLSCGGASPPVPRPRPW